MSVRRKAGDVVFKPGFVGFIREGAYALICEEDEDWQMCCVLSCGDDDCMEWMDVWMLPGNTVEEANEARRNENYIGLACHVSECEMYDSKEDWMRKTRA